MSFIKVPIGRGIGLPPRQEIQKMPPTPNEQSFLKQLDDEGRLLIVEGSRTSDGEVLSITPVTGTTFYYLGASCAAAHSSVQTKLFTLSINGTDVENVGIPPSNGFGEFKLKTASVVGNGINNIAIDVDVSSGGTGFASIWGYNENTPSFRSGG